MVTNSQRSAEGMSFCRRNGLSPNSICTERLSSLLGTDMTVLGFTISLGQCKAARELSEGKGVIPLPRSDCGPNYWESRIARVGTRSRSKAATKTDMVERLAGSR